MSGLATLIKQFNKDKKEEVLSIGVKANGIEIKDPERLPSGIFTLDLQLGGGIPTARVTTVFGPESCAKTTLCMKWIAMAQRKWPDKKAVLIDLEYTYAPSWGASMGVDNDALVYVTPASAEQCVDIVQALLHEADDVSIIVIDSLAALITDREVGSSAEDSMVGVSGLLINKLYRKINHGMGRARAKGFCPTVVCINQIRFKIGVSHGDPETQPGGPSFKFAASLALRLYGKDEFVKDVSTKLPAFKKVSVIVKKWKVPISARNGEFLLALLPNEKFKLKVGDSYDVGTIMQYLKTYELLAKAPKAGWLLCDEHGEIMLEAKTLDVVEAKLRDDIEFSDRVRATVFRVVLDRGDLIEAE
jgi:recombination protein RecA